MKNPPAGWPRIASAVFYDNPSAAIDWLCKAFGFEVRIKVEGEGGRIEYCELELGGGLIMIHGTDGKSGRATPVPGKSPRAVAGANTQIMCVCIDDPDAHARHAKAAGAKIIDEPSTSDYGEEYWSDRAYRAEDPEGHHWWFMQRVREPKPR